MSFYCYLLLEFEITAFNLIQLVIEQKTCCFKDFFSIVQMDVAILSKQSSLTETFATILNLVGDV